MSSPCPWFWDSNQNPKGGPFCTLLLKTGRDAMDLILLTSSISQAHRQTKMVLRDGVKGTGYHAFLVLQFRSPNPDMPYTCFNSEANFHFAQCPGCVMKANIQGRLGDLCRMPSWLRRSLGAKLLKRSDSSRAKEFPGGVPHKQRNRIKVAFKTNVKEPGDITRGPHTYQRENVTSVPQHSYKSQAWRPGSVIPTLRKGMEESLVG